MPLVQLGGFIVKTIRTAEILTNEGKSNSS
jgi:hypothetical protein